MKIHHSYLHITQFILFFWIRSFDENSTNNQGRRIFSNNEWNAIGCLATGYRYGCFMPESHCVDFVLVWMSVCMRTFRIRIPSIRLQSHKRYFKCLRPHECHLSMSILRPKYFDSRNSIRSLVTILPILNESLRRYNFINIRFLNETLEWNFHNFGLKFARVPIF